MSGRASLSYLIQRYKFLGQSRVSIFLYSSATAMNSLTRLSHQVDAELNSFQIAVKDVKKCVKTLQDFNIRLEGGPILISDSQSCLSLCSKPSSTLDLSTSLIVSRVKEVFTRSNLFFAPSKIFENGVDLLTKYRPKLMTLISNQFYSPDWLKPEIPDRLTIKVANMRKAQNLPHFCEKALMKGSTLGGNLFQQKPSTDQPPKGFHSTGTWGLQMKQKCQPVKTCRVCGTAPLGEPSEMDTKLLKAAEDKQMKKVPAKPKLLTNPEDNTSFSAAALNTFSFKKEKGSTLCQNWTQRQRIGQARYKYLENSYCQQERIHLFCQSMNQNSENFLDCRQ